MASKKSVLEAAERYAEELDAQFGDAALRQRCLLWALQSAGPNPDPGAVVFAAEVYRRFLTTVAKPKPTLH